MQHSLNNIQDRNLSTLLETTAHIIDLPAISYFCQDRFQNESRKRIQRILIVSLQEHSRVGIDTTISNRKHDRIIHDMLGFQDPRIELILDHFDLDDAVRNWSERHLRSHFKSTERFCSLLEKYFLKQEIPSKPLSMRTVFQQTSWLNQWRETFK